MRLNPRHHPSGYLVQIPEDTSDGLVLVVDEDCDSMQDQSAIIGSKSISEPEHDRLRICTFTCDGHPAWTPLVG
jgi:hypothetical protein